jgi:hypothetical protein
MTTVASPTREPTLAERFDPRPADLARLENAIARRNATWLSWRTAVAALEAADERGVRDRRPYVQYANDAQRDYEHARTDLIFEQVRWERDGTPW